MKKAGGILTVLLLAAIYCFAIGFASIAHATTETHQVQNDDQQEYFSEISESVICQVSFSESSIQFLNKFPKRAVKISFIGISPSLETTEQLIESEFSQYNGFSRNILTRFRKSDSIFPFHYFW